VTLAIRTQQVIAYETGVTNEPDPLGGSDYVERLTDEIERGAEDYIRRIDDMGGTLAAIENNFIRNEIHNAAFAYQQAIEKGEKIVVGVNRFVEQKHAAPPIFQMDSSIEKRQIECVRELRATRAAGPVSSALDALESAARGSDNLMPRILAACEAKATVGEISDRLRKVFGEYRES
jgi:methylmalonyl-CoA mutase N-terminal domain/subunit